MDAFQILIDIYVVINLINIFIASIQYFNDRNIVQRTILFYWIGHFISVAANAFVNETNMTFLTVAVAGTFVTNSFLGKFFAKIHDIEINIRPLIVFYLICYAIAWILVGLGLSFVYYAIPLLFGGVSPLAVSLYKVLRGKKKPLTMTQKIFVGLACFMIAHWLDFSYFRMNPDLFFLGTCIALAVLHILSILTPIMGTEHTLQVRNDRLEEEVKRKVEQLTAVEVSLWESNKLASLGQLSGGVAHEINNPLQIINLHTETLKAKATSGTVSNEDVIQATNRIENMIDRISKITESLRKIARDHRTVHMQENDLVQFVKDTVVLCNDKFASKNINFSMDLPSVPTFVKCNSIEISQVILNLLNNSIDAIDLLETKKITLSLWQNEDQVFLTIEDSGKISPDVVPHLMEPFYTTKPLGKGTGLGLSISKSIAESHDGKLYYDKNKTHTTFVLEFKKI